MHHAKALQLLPTNQHFNSVCCTQRKALIFFNCLFHDFLLIKSFSLESTDFCRALLDIFLLFLYETRCETVSANTAPGRSEMLLSASLALRQDWLTAGSSRIAGAGGINGTQGFITTKTHEDHTFLTLTAYSESSDICPFTTQN